MMKPFNQFIHENLRKELEIGAIYEVVPKLTQPPVRPGVTHVLKVIGTLSDVYINMNNFNPLIVKYIGRNRERSYNLTFQILHGLDNDVFVYDAYDEEFVHDKLDSYTTHIDDASNTTFKWGKHIMLHPDNNFRKLTPEEIAGLQF